MKRIFWVCVFALVAGGGGAGGFGSVAHAEIEAITTARYDLELGFTIGGKVANIPVKPGDHVEKDQLLIRLENFEGEALIKLYELRAASELEVKSAEARLHLATVEERAIRTAFENDAAKPIEVNRAEIQTTLAKLELEMSNQRRQETQHQLEQARARDDQYVMRAPTAGIVDMLVVEPGEVVEALKPIMRLVVTDPLWVDAAVPTEQTMKLKVGQSAWIKSILAGYDRPIEGKIIHVAAVADAASDTRLVRIEVPNSLGLPAGVQAVVSFEGEDGLAMGGPTTETGGVTTVEAR